MPGQKSFIEHKHSGFYLDKYGVYVETGMWAHILKAITECPVWLHKTRVDTLDSPWL